MHVQAVFIPFIFVRMEEKGKILIIDDNKDVLFALNLLLEPYMQKVKVTTQPARIEYFMRTFQPDVVLLDMNFHRDAVSGQEGFEYLGQILEIDPQAVVIFMTAYSDIEKAVKAIKVGATDFISKPWETEKLLATLSSGIRLSHSRKEVGRLREQMKAMKEDDTLPELIGESPAMLKVTTQPARIEYFMRTFQPDVVLLDMNFHRDAVSGQEGFEYLGQILEIDPQAVVIFMTAYSDIEKAVKAIKVGATDFISKPWETEKLLATLSSGIRLSHSRKEVGRLREQMKAMKEDDTLPELIGESPAMLKVKDTIYKLVETDANILITGESGTGKDLVARLLRHYSPRRDDAFVTIDLGSIPEQLFESELFGYEKGAFTDARRSKPGRMEMASGGTLFLDEIGNLSLPMQSKLLTAIEKRHITRLGAVEPISIDVRLICATNANLRQLVGEGSFRQDLLYRINTIEIAIPPLRERGEDILMLADHFQRLYSRKYKKTIKGLSRETGSKLMKYPWPGNVRELQHVLERAVILNEGTVLRPDDFPLYTASYERKKEPDPDLNLEQAERKIIERALRQSNGNMSYAAELLGITRFSLYRKIEKFGL